MKKVMLLLLTHLFLASLEGAIPYNTRFEGNLDASTLKVLKDASQLVSLQEHPPETKSALKKRAESDTENLIQALHGLALYNALISYTIDDSKNPIEVTLLIVPGTAYPFKGGIVLPESLHLTTQELGIEPGICAYPSSIFRAEENLLILLAKRSYPFAEIKKTQVIADQKTKDVFVTFDVEPGVQSFFGKLLIKGNETVENRFIEQKVLWKEGDPFDADQIASTIHALESTGLFRAVSITYPEESLRILPLTIEVEEAKHRTIALGLSYSTQRGPGFTLEWEHRNVLGMGHRFFFDANILQYIQQVKTQYLLPDFLTPCQDLIWTFEVEHDDTEAFEETWASLSGMIERKISPNLRLSYGAMYKQLLISDSDRDGSFGLLKSPMQMRWTNADDLLDPISGGTIFFKFVPTAQFSKNPSFYLINHLNGSYYIPFGDGSFVLAARGQLGMILGSSKQEIPVSERLFAGSETTLRGYGYYTVSPLDDNGKPVGGRSLSVFSLEGRARFTEHWGGALFYDVGNVFKEPYPALKGKWLQSVGLGVRYYTPVGPLRADIAFPLNRRKHLDGAFQFYFSVGQAF